MGTKLKERTETQVWHKGHRTLGREAEDPRASRDTERHDVSEQRETSGC